MAAAVAAAAAAAQPSPSSTEIQQSPLDYRLYRRMVLPNVLAVLLISDLEMAAALNRREREAAEEGGGDHSEMGWCARPSATAPIPGMSKLQWLCWWKRLGDNFCSGWRQGRAAEDAARRGPATACAVLCVACGHGGASSIPCARSLPDMRSSCTRRRPAP